MYSRGNRCLSDALISQCNTQRTQDQEGYVRTPNVTHPYAAAFSMITILASSPIPLSVRI